MINCIFKYKFKHHPCLCVVMCVCLKEAYAQKESELILVYWGSVFPEISVSFIKKRVR